MTSKENQLWEELGLRSRHLASLTTTAQMHDAANANMPVYLTGTHARAVAIEAMCSALSTLCISTQLLLERGAGRGSAGALPVASSAVVDVQAVSDAVRSALDGFREELAKLRASGGRDGAG